MVNINIVNFVYINTCRIYCNNNFIRKLSTTTGVIDMNCPTCNEEISILNINYCDICNFQACRKCWMHHNCLDVSLEEWSEEKMLPIFQIINYKSHTKLYFEAEPRWMYLQNNFFLDRQLRAFREALSLLV